MNFKIEMNELNNTELWICFTLWSFLLICAPLDTSDWILETKNPRFGTEEKKYLRVHLLIFLCPLLILCLVILIK